MTWLRVCAAGSARLGEANRSHSWSLFAAMVRPPGAKHLDQDGLQIGWHALKYSEGRATPASAALARASRLNGHAQRPHLSEKLLWTAIDNTVQAIRQRAFDVGC